MEGDCSRVMVDVEGGPVYPSPTVTLEREKSTHRWRLCGALLAMALCVSAALFITWHAKKQDHAEEVDELQHTLRQLSGNRKAAIHLEGYYNSSGKYKTDDVEWTDDVSQGFSQGGLKLNNNEIVIPQLGLYFVYSQVSFHVSCKADHKHSNNQDMVHLSNTVKRWSPSYGNDDSKEYQILLNSVRTVCKKSSNSEAASEGKWYNAVYMGAVFSLEKGDRLRTETRLLPHLENGPGKNFFGVFAL